MTESAHSIDLAVAIIRLDGGVAHTELFTQLKHHLPQELLQTQAAWS